MSKKQRGTIKGYLMTGTRAVYVDVTNINYLVHGFSMPHIDDFFDTNSIHKVEMVDWTTHDSFVLYYEENSDQLAISELHNRFNISFCGIMLLFKRQKGGTSLVSLSSTHLEAGMECVEWWLKERNIA